MKENNLITRLFQINKTENNPLIQCKNNNFKINLEESLKEILIDLQNNNFNNDELKFILNNINNTIKYSKEIIKNK